MMQEYFDSYQLVTIDFFRLNLILNKMVRMKAISQEEKDSLLHKAGLLKQEDGKWLEKSTGAVLTLQN